MHITIALLQLLPESSIEKNIQKGVDACRKARNMGADIVLFPEMWSIGYNSEYMQDAYAVDQSSAYVQTFCRLAQELEMAIILTYLTHGNIKPRNAALIIDRYGKVVLEYTKVHICAFDEGTEQKLEPGDQFPVADVQLRPGVVRIGCMICFDREFPESARMLAQQEAELIVVPNACDIKHDKDVGDIRFCQLRARAFENMACVAFTNYPRPLHDGHSTVIMPNGEPIVTADEHEQILIASCDIDALRTWRSKEVWGPRNTKYKVAL